MSWAIGFVTLEKPVTAQRFVRSARHMFPDVPIYVAEQSRRLGPMAEFYEVEGVTVIPMPFDAGLSASRNALVEAMNEDFFALCDDDFVLGPATSFSSAINVLQQDDELGAVGGMLHDYDGMTERIRNWEMFFDHDERNGRFTATPIYNYPPIRREIAGEMVFLCDAVLNFAVFRKAIFSTRIRWEERIKINGEHEDFYLNLKKNSSYRVAYLPAMAALHWHVPQHGYLADLRLRDEGRREFLKKWGLSSHLEIGTGGRPLDGTPVSGWFIGGNHEEGNNSNYKSHHKRPSSHTPAGISHMLLYSAAAREEAGIVRDAAGPPSFLDWIASDGSFDQPISPGRFLFFYQPAIDPEGDLLLWYRGMNASDGYVEKENCGMVVLRWFSSSGDVLMWESEANAIRCSEDRYWQPLSAPIPLWPRGAAYLRFEVVSASDERTPLATGFVFADSRAYEGRGLDESAGVLALCRTTAEAEGVEVAPKPLAELLTSAPQLEIELLRKAGQSWVTMDVSNLGFVGISIGRGTGTTFVLAAGLRRRSFASMPLALPLSLVLDPESVSFAGDTGRAGGPLFVLVPRLIDVTPPSNMG